MIWLVTAAASACGMALVYGLLGYGASQRAFADRLDRAVPAPGPARPTAPLHWRLAQAVGDAAQRVLPPTWLSFLRRRLQAAGLRTTVEQFVGRWTIMLGGWYLVMSMLALVSQVPGWLIAAALVLALLAPFALLSRQEAERARRIRKEFPFMIDFITMAVEAGLSLDSALLRAGTKLKGPLGDELQRYVQNINHGLTRREALTLVAGSLGLPEVKDFVQVLIQSATSGLPLAEVLRRQAQQIRELQRLQAEESAQKIPIKLLFPLVLFVFPTIFLFVLGPALIWLIQHGL